MVLEALGNAGEEKHGQDRGVLPVNYPNDFAVEARRPRHDDVVLLKVWMADTETTETGIPGDE